MNDDASLPYLIVTGSSAGGIEALRSFVAGLPPDLPASVIIAQHLAPTYDSHLAQILAEQTTLEIKTVVHREPLREGTIYLVPPDRNIEVYDHAAIAVTDRVRRAKPSVDRLFVTGAEHFGDRLIGVVLSGMGNDGSAGARAIKNFGGAVIVQDPASAGFPSMPLAIPPTLVDFVAAPQNMGAIIASLLSRGRAAAQIGDQQHIRDLLLELRERTGIDFLQYKMPTIQRRLSRLMVAVNAATLGDYVAYLRANPDGYQRLVSAFLIKVTEFFRDAAFFDALKERILPRLISEAASEGRGLRIWSAGCSTGEEAYSVAILCAELYRQSGTQLDVRIFATDLDQDAIGFARVGRYSRESLERVPPEWIERYFVQSGDNYEVKNLRNITVFGHHDLAQRAPFPRIDLILCRNVLIYFVKDLQTRALQLFAFSLRDGGVLALGKSESTSQLEEYFEPLDASIKTFKRVGKRTLIPPLHIKSMASPAGDKISLANTGSLWPAAPNEYELRNLSRPNSLEIFGTFLQRSPVGIAVVDRRYDIVAINESARSYLEIHGVAIGHDLLHLARNLDSAKLRDLIDSGFRAEAPQTRELFAGDLEGVERWLAVDAHCEPSPSNTIDGVALTFVEVSQAVRQRHELEEVDRKQKQAIEDLQGRVADLDRRQRGLLVGNEELTAANSQLRQINEQLVISSEEAASASEEIETLYEEMQATNEELETLNEELQSTVEELNTTNDELESRTVSLQLTSDEHKANIVEHESTRRALVEALRMIGSCVAVVDNDGRPLYLSEKLGNSIALEGLGPGGVRTGRSTWAERA